MLAFDIETTGLDFRAHRITVACIYDPDRGIKRAFNFAADPSMHDSERDAFIRALDDAPSLCCFNGTRFDIPFIAHSFGLSPEKQGQWVLKSLDLFEVCRLCFRSSCSLNNLLKANGHEVKSSSGSQAVQWAAEGQWDLLEDYCMQDTVLTHQISSQTLPVKLPLTGWSSISVLVKKEERESHPGLLFEKAPKTQLVLQ